ncbi:MAG: hypothetical protein AAGA62_05630 [Bacteroidota bacterium]
MRQLEEQLKLSRQREREGLQPPEDGWSALEAKLPDPKGSTGGVAPKSSTAGAAAKSYSLWVVGVGVLSLVMLLASWPAGTEIKSEPGENERAPAIPASPPEPMVAPAKQLSVPNSSVPKQVKEDLVAPVAVEVELVQEADKNDINSNSFRTKKNHQQADVNIVVQNDVLPAKNTPVGSEKKTTSTTTVAPLERKIGAIPERLPTAFTSFGTQRKPAAATLTTNTALRLPEVNVAKNRKPRGRAEWQWHLSASGTAYTQDWGVGYGRYRRATGNDATIQFILPSGELIQTTQVNNFDGEGNNVFEAGLIRFGLDRQTHWGGTFRNSIGFFRGTYRENRNNFMALPNDEVWTAVSNEENAIPLELGFRYTFRRRKRLRSYLELNTFSLLYYRGVHNSTFVDGQTRQQGLIRRFESTEYASFFSDVSFSAGIQYQATPRLALSAFVWANTGASVFLEAPFGLEVRHSLR